MIRDQNVPCFVSVRTAFPACLTFTSLLAQQAHLGRDRIKPEPQIRKIKSKKSLFNSWAKTKGVFNEILFFACRDSKIADFPQHLYSQMRRIPNPAHCLQ